MPTQMQLNQRCALIIVRLFVPAAFDANMMAVYMFALHAPPKRCQFARSVTKKQVCAIWLALAHANVSALAGRARSVARAWRRAQ